MKECDSYLVEDEKESFWKAGRGHRFSNFGPAILPFVAPPEIDFLHLFLELFLMICGTVGFK